ncbi:MAG: UDP-glucose/GDP-mannose dehydrogenase family protein [Candidatus Woesearchaeota archaeon]|nr:UDP-glucose/GDP-mannose dehydrogenase family protein [Candidatus Woesearchaeota archaeon]
MTISIIGTGYVGLITGAAFAKLGFKVICVDRNKAKVDKINSGIATIYEEGLPETLSAYAPKMLYATTDLKKAVLDSSVTFICVGTPSLIEGRIYLQQMQDVAMEIGTALKSDRKKHVIVVKSTVVPETTEKVIIPKLEEFSKKKFGRDFGVAINPEFLREGTALSDFLSPDRIVIGSSDKKSIEYLKRIYHGINAPIVECTFKEGEMIKYASNAFLATKISFINEIGNICKKLRIDTNNVAAAIGLDKRIGPHFLKSGIGFGGSCFPKDVNALVYKATEKGYNARLLRAVLDVNMEQPLKLLSILDSNGYLNGSTKIGILGLTFKAGTDDTRESPALEVLKGLMLRSVELHIYDPLGMGQVKKIFPQLNYEKSAQEVADKSDVILILTEWAEFKKVKFNGKKVIDGKNLFREGERPINYEGICW